MSCRLVLIHPSGEYDDIAFNMDDDKATVLEQIKNLLEGALSYITVDITEDNMVYLLTADVVAQCIISISDEEEDKENKCRLVRFKPPGD